jgi:hypothetical protein
MAIRSPAFVCVEYCFPTEKQKDESFARTAMNAQLAVLILYMAGSLCFFVGTAISLWVHLT